MGTSYQQSLKDTVSAHLRELKRDEEKLATYNNNKDCQIDLTGWEEARKDAKRTVLEQQLPNPLPTKNISDIFALI